MVTALTSEVNINALVLPASVEIVFPTIVTLPAFTVPADKEPSTITALTSEVNINALVLPASVEIVFPLIVTLPADKEPSTITALTSEVNINALVLPAGVEMVFATSQTLSASQELAFSCVVAVAFPTAHPLKIITNTIKEIVPKKNILFIFYTSFLLFTMTGGSKHLLI